MPISQLNAQERLRATMAVAALRSNAAKPAEPTVATRAKDAVSISPEARALSAARQQAATTSLTPSRDERIAALKAAVASGTYSVSARDLATSLLKAADVDLKS